MATDPINIKIDEAGIADMKVEDASPAESAEIIDEIENMSDDDLKIVSVRRFNA